MKVYGINLDGTYRGVVAAKNKKEAAKLFNVSLYHAKQYCSETGNTEEVTIAMRQPGIVWKRVSHIYNSSWLKHSK